MYKMHTYSYVHNTMYTIKLNVHNTTYIIHCTKWIHITTYIIQCIMCYKCRCITCYKCRCIMCYKCRCITCYKCWCIMCNKCRCITCYKCRYRTCLMILTRKTTKKFIWERSSCMSELLMMISTKTLRYTLIFIQITFSNS